MVTSDEEVECKQFCSEDGVVYLAKILPEGAQAICLEMGPAHFDKRGRPRGKLVKCRLWYKETKDKRRGSKW